MKELLEDKIEEKEKILHKNNFLAFSFLCILVLDKVLYL